MNSLSVFKVPHVQIPKKKVEYKSKIKIQVNLLSDNTSVIDLGSPYVGLKFPNILRPTKPVASRLTEAERLPQLPFFNFSRCWRPWRCPCRLKPSGHFHGACSSFAADSSTCCPNSAAFHPCWRAPPLPLLLLPLLLHLPPLEPLPLLEPALLEPPPPPPPLLPPLPPLPPLYPPPASQTNLRSCFHAAFVALAAAARFLVKYLNQVVLITAVAAADMAPPHLLPLVSG